jgi:hypothetical protein
MLRRGRLLALRQKLVQVNAVDPYNPLHFPGGKKKGRSGSPGGFVTIGNPCKFIFGFDLLYEGDAKSLRTLIASFYKQIRHSTSTNSEALFRLRTKHAA